jgi:hypothetical protein
MLGALAAIAAAELLGLHLSELGIDPDEVNALEDELEAPPASAVLEPGITWRTRMPRGVLDPLGPRGEPITTPTDRRMLEDALSSTGETTPGDEKKQAGGSGIVPEPGTSRSADDASPGPGATRRICAWCHGPILDDASRPTSPATADPAGRPS